MVESYIRQIEKNLPESGKTHILAFTDKQYENMKTFRGKKRDKKQENPDQFTLFWGKIEKNF